ncbi:MAG TPA: hydroxyacylglutathione hydrolase [Nevskiaceae bacterium]|nr:hydroxyacylglutathione hydrolase [Nevskiaceae bacterium]
MRTMIAMFAITAIPAFTDNYLWLLQHDRRAVVVDPGDAQPVLKELQARGLELDAILVTHWHPDHIGGLGALTARYPVPVYGPRGESAKIAGLTRWLGEGERVSVLGQFEFQVLEVPGHTLGHIAYYCAAAGILFCGDTLFSAGCGRLFEGTPAQMHASLARLSALPPETRVYCTHEYTLSNLAFAHEVEPANRALAARIAEVRSLREQNLPSLPSSIEAELKFNPFLRCDQPEVRAAAWRRAKKDVEHPADVFAVLRAWKDGYKG